VASDELILSKEAIEGWPRGREASADREELLEVISDNLQAGQSAGRAWLERCVVATERGVIVVNRNREWCGPVSRTALLDIGDRRLRHEPFFVVPECLRKVIHGSVGHYTYPQYQEVSVGTCLHVVKDHRRL